MKYFCLPADFKFSTIDSYYELNCTYNGSKIIETYGQMAPDTLFGSCRAVSQLPEVSSERLEKYIKHCKDRGIEFNYVINTACMANEELTKEGYKKLKEFFLTLCELGVDSVTLALPSLMEIAKHECPSLKIKASTICQINSPTKAEFYGKMGIGRIVLDEDIYRKFDVLKNIRKAYEGEIEIIINSFCLNDCPYKMFHYNSFSHVHEVKDLYPYYSRRCKLTHLGEEKFMKLNWIRPEDLHYYYELGIRYFKIQGRTNITLGEPAKAITHYMEESYNGDLIKLLELFSSKRPLAIAECSIDNRKLDGFLQKFADNPGFCTKLCKECNHCKSYGQSSMTNSDMTIMDFMKNISNLVMNDFTETLGK